jgi:hypothetical protein
VIDYSAEAPRTRLRLDVTLTYEGDLAVVRSLLESAAAGVDGVIAGAPDTRITRDGAVRATESPSVVIYTDGGTRWGYYRSNCGTVDTAVDTMGRTERDVRANRHRAEAWDATRE